MQENYALGLKQQSSEINCVSLASKLSCKCNFS